jgi:hypothetical protein
MTIVQRDAASPTTGLQIWCSDCDGGETQILMAVFGLILLKQKQIEQQQQQNRLMLMVFLVCKNSKRIKTQLLV